MFFLKTMAKQKDNLAAKVKEEQLLRAFLPALSRQILARAGEDAQRDHGQGNRGIHRCQPKHHQGAREETGRAAISAAGRPVTRRALFDQVTAGLLQLATSGPLVAIWIEWRGSFRFRPSRGYFFGRDSGGTIPATR